MPPVSVSVVAVPWLFRSGQAAFGRACGYTPGASLACLITSAFLRLHPWNARRRRCIQETAARKNVCVNKCGRTSLVQIVSRRSPLSSVGPQSCCIESHLRLSQVATRSLMLPHDTITRILNIVPSTREPSRISTTTTNLAND